MFQYKQFNASYLDVVDHFLMLANIVDKVSTRVKVIVEVRWKGLGMVAGVEPSEYLQKIPKQTIHSWENLKT